MKTFDKTINKLCGKEDKYTVFNEWLDYAIAFSEITPNKAEPTMERLKTKYGEDTQIFFEAYSVWLTQMQKHLETKSHYDYIGEYYTEFIQSGSKASDRGQFFTPQCVTDAMATLVNDPNNNGYIYDAAGGSGRTLLASHVISPEAICISWDLDSMACKMCALNFLVHGVVGAVVNCNSLSQEFYTGWKINETVPILGHEGLGIMEVHSMVGAHTFISKPVKFSTKTTVSVNTGNDNRIPAQSGQTVLM